MTSFKLVGAALVLLMASSGIVKAERLKYGDYTPQGANEYAKSAEWMGNEVAKRSGNKHSMQMIWGGTVVKVGEVPTAVENRVIDLGPLVTPYFPDQFPVNNMIPFFWPQPKSQAQLGALMLKWYSEHPAFSAELAKYKLRMVSVRPLPSYGMICTKPVRTMADFKGLRIRSYGVALPAMIEALGAVPVSMADIDGYEALRNGILDCSPGDPALTVGWKWADVAKFLRSYAKATDDTLAAWKANRKVEVIAFPKDEFLKVTLGNAKVQSVRNSWVGRAVKAGMPEASARKVVSDLTN
jgi:TRAP-type C4-dicarboxylate transport system substrate-binding protein